MRILKHVAILALFSAGSLYSQSLYSLTLSFRIFSSDAAHQCEPVITVSPLNPLIMFCSAVTVDADTLSIRSEGIYVTTNGGLNWTGTDRTNANNTTNHGGDPGIAIDRNGIFLLYHIGYIQIGVFTHYSTNMGQTWSSQYTISQQVPPEDKGTMTTDNNPSSPFYGRTYISWVNFQAPSYPVLFSYTTNSGTTWSSYSQVNPSAPQRCSGGDVKTGTNGEVYDTWAGVSSTLPNYEQLAGFASSTNGGATWNVSQNIFAMHGIGGLLPAKGNILVNGLPRLAVDLTSGPRRGWIYIVTNEINNSPAGSDPDIIFHRSTNGGQTWSQGIKVNQDPLNNGKIQYFPAICVDSTGAIDILYYDDRNTTTDSTDVFMSRSTNGGNSWYDFPVSDRRFKPEPILQNTHFQGDFIEMTSARNKLFPVWMAKYTGTYQIWTTILDLDAIGVQKISTEVPKDFILKQNYPNPFNPSTNIEFSLPANSEIKLIIYDSDGREIASLLNANLKPGAYRTTFDGTNLASGVYYYRLIMYDPSTSSRLTDGQAGQSFSVSKKMILLK